MNSLVEETRLPALTVEVEGKVLASNLDSFKTDVKVLVDGINKSLEVDEDFAGAEDDIKFCSKSELALKEKHADIQGQIVSVDQVLRTIMFCHDMFRTTRLDLEREVKKSKDSKKVIILTTATGTLRTHIAKCEAEVAPYRIEITEPNFLDSMKNRRSLKACEEAVQADLDTAIMSIDKVAADIRAKLSWFKESGAVEYQFLFGDLQLLLNKPMEDYQVFVNDRIRTRKEHEAKERDKVRLEEEAKAKAKVEAEAKAKVEAEIKADLEAETKQKRADLAKTPIQEPAKEIPAPAVPRQVTEEGERNERIERLRGARAICDTFLAMYMSLNDVGMIRQEMLSFLKITDWVE